MKKRGLTWDEKITAYLRRRQIRQAKKHNAWLDANMPRMLAATWQGGTYSVPMTFLIPILDDPAGLGVLDEFGNQIYQDP